MTFQEGLISISVVALVFFGIGYLVYTKVLNDNPVAAEKIKNFSFKNFLKDNETSKMDKDIIIEGKETLM